jgi:phosphoserine aminotransferase
VKIRTTDGRTFDDFVDEADGTGARALAPERIAAKFRTTAGSALPPAKVERLIGIVSTLETLPSARMLMEATA